MSVYRDGWVCIGHVRRMRFRWIGRLGLAVIAGGLTVGAGLGCKATHLVYGHNLVVGLDVSPAAQDGSGKVVVGYDRQVFAVVPRISKHEAIATLEKARAEGASQAQIGGQGKPGESEAMTLVSLQNVELKDLNHFRFTTFTAAGSAAVKLAPKESDIKKIRDDMFKVTPETTK